MDRTAKRSPQRIVPKIRTPSHIQDGAYELFREMVEEDEPKATEIIMRGHLNVRQEQEEERSGCVRSTTTLASDVTSATPSKRPTTKQHNRLGTGWPKLPAKLPKKATTLLKRK